MLPSVAWYLSIGLAVAIEVGGHQATRFNPGFDPVFTAIVTVFMWPVVLGWDTYLFIAHLSGALPRH